mmetsp:Transcript_30282/g.46224  ORF Transcript_30282/g.46224 Transcript_30282/m.46224 type:complete len:397 (+) Transcript_30282:148-1338(+)
MEDCRLLGACHGSNEPVSTSESNILRQCADYCLNDLKEFQNHRQNEPFKNNKNGRWRNLLFGQAVAFIACSQNVISFTLESKLGIVSPMILMFPAYLLLSLHLFAANRSEEIMAEAIHKVPGTSIKIRVPFYYYLGLSFLDIGPNYLILLSLNRASLTSVSLLGSMTIPSTMIACRFLLDKKFRKCHFIGVFLCLCGGIITVLGDSNNSSSGILKRSDSFSGDALAILAAIVYGVGDAACEFWTKNIDRKEYLGMIGLLGSCNTFLLFLLFESRNIYNAFTTHGFPNFTIILMVGYACFLAAYYISATLFLVKCDATLLNLSLQASNLWAILFSIVAFDEPPPSLFFLAAILVSSGVCIYEICGGVDTNSKNDPQVASHSDGHIDYQSTSISDLVD